MADGTDLLNRVLTVLTDVAVIGDEMNAIAMDSEIGAGVMLKPDIVDGSVSVAQHRTSGVHLLVGDSATLAGVAKYFISLYDVLQSMQLSAFELQMVGVELFRFGTEVTFGQALEPTEERMRQLWWSGTLLPVPALLDRSVVPPRLVVDFTRIQTAIDAAVPRLAPPELARVPAGALTTFNPMDATAPATTTVEAARTRVVSELAATVTAEDWRRRMCWNPYAAAFPIVHLISVSASSAQRLALIDTLIDRAATALTPLQLSRVAATSGGTVLLRIGHHALFDATATQNTRIAAALGITPTTNLRTRALGIGREPPSPATAKLDEPRKEKLKFSRPFLGRPVQLTWSVYKDNSKTAWEGPASADGGSIYPSSYFDFTSSQYKNDLAGVGDATGTALTDPKLQDRLRVIKAIFDIEGHADAVRSVDKALASVGMQQFSFHVEEEGTVLFRRIRGLTDTWFDVFFRSAGLDVGKAPPNVNLAALESPGPHNLTDAPILDRPSASGVTQYPQFDEPAWLIKLAANGDNQWCVPGTVGTLAAKTKTVTISIGTPALITSPGHTLAVGTRLIFTSSGALPSGLTPKKQNYFVIADGFTANTFQVSKTLGGPAVATTGTQRGVHKVTTVDAVKAFPRVTGSPDALHTDCRDAFAWVPGTNRASSMTEELLARWAIAARFVPEVVRVQMELCVHRFNRLQHYADQVFGAKTRWETLFQTASDPAITFEQLFPSPAHAAVVIDCFINSPAFALSTGRRAFDRYSTAHGVSEPVDPSDQDFRVRTLVAYLSERNYTGGKTDSLKSARGSANNVSPDRVVRILDRLEEITPSSATLGPRVLKWTENFNW